MNPAGITCIPVRPRSSRDRKLTHKLNVKGHFVFSTIGSARVLFADTETYGYGVPMAFCARNLLPCADKTEILLLPKLREGISNVTETKVPNTLLRIGE
jgi:hypothetical protein